MIFASSIWTLEIDGKPTLAFEAMKYREADEICHQEWLRIELGQRKINNVPLCGADSHLRIRLARPAEILLYRQAAEANKLSDNKHLESQLSKENITAKAEAGRLPPLLCSFGNNLPPFWKGLHV